MIKERAIQSPDSHSISRDTPSNEYNTPQKNPFKLAYNINPTSIAVDASNEILIKPRENIRYSIESENKIINSKTNEDSYSSSIRSSNDRINNLNIIKLKHIEEMRKEIFSYKILNNKSELLTSNINTKSLNKINIILFGPTNSGKSSFIKSIHRALYNTYILPPDATEKIIINHNGKEGTKKFSKIHLKEANFNDSSSIILFDTKGHCKYNEEEIEIFKALINGKIKENVEIKMKDKNNFSIWDFISKDSEKFPKEIINYEYLNNDRVLEIIPHLIVFVFDGSEENISKNKIIFYRELIKLSKAKGYNNIHIILTKIDLFEKNIKESYFSIPNTERNTILNNKKDEEIEKVIDYLGINRSNIHFIENYHNSKKKENDLELDYQILKTMNGILNSCDLFVINYFNKSSMCFKGCFVNNK